MKSLPKVELHLHLEGAAPPEFIKSLAAEKSVNLGGIFDAEGGYVFKDFNQFLSTYEAATSVLQTPHDFYLLTKAVLEQSAEQGIIYTEAFLSPDFCGGRDVVAWQDFLAAIVDAANEAKRDFGIEMRGIITCIRHFGPEWAKETAHCAAETAGPFITGFGIAGDEKAGEPKDFAYAFDMAREAGLRLTAHAGEWGGPKSVSDALRDLKVERIGHGVQSIDDPSLVEQLVASEITLEICPGSNVALGVYSNWAQHPIQKLIDAGVKVTISTDDPPFFHTDMTYEYETLAKTFGWSTDMFSKLNKTAANAAFCDEATRLKIIQKLGDQ